MARIARIAALALLVAASPLSAQPLFFGDPAPQTHTRYGATGALPRLATNGSDFFLFWATESRLRVTRLVDGQKRAGRPVAGGSNIRDFDVVWTGTHFLVAAEDRNPAGVSQIVGRVLNVHGEPLGAAFPIVANGESPRLAFDGARVLMTYATHGGLSSLLLRPDGVHATDPHHQTIAAPRPLDSAASSGAQPFVSAAAYDGSVRITTFLPTSEIDEAEQFALPPAVERRVALGTDGTDVLVAWTNGSGPAEWLILHPNGDMSARRQLTGTEGAADVAAAWNGDAWVVSVIANGKLMSRFVEGSTNAEAHAPVRANAASPVSVASLQGRTLAAWRDTAAGQPVVVRDLAGSGNGQDAAFAAAEQTLQTAAWSHEAALVVWSELRDGRRTLHAGVRTHAGSWRENRIGSDEEVSVAESDGAMFLVVKQSGSSWSATTLSESAEILASSVTERAFLPTDIAWDGDAWVVVGVSPDGKKIYGVRVFRWGGMTTPAVILTADAGYQFENPRIVTGRDGFLLVWQRSKSEICFPVCDPYTSEVFAGRMQKNLQMLDGIHNPIAPDEAISPDAFWDGLRYTVFWLDDGALEMRTIRPSDGFPSATVRIGGANIDTGRIRAELTPFGATITSGDGEVLLIRNNKLVQRYTLGEANSPDALVNLGPDVAYVQAPRRDEMPYHGATHVFLRTGGVIPRDTLPLPPEIVRASMTDNGKLIVVEWKPPIDTIQGYRLEYRVDDGTWNELDTWIDAGTISLSIQPWLEKVKYQFRIRAYSEAGVSEYSLPATVRLLGRRRAMR